MPQFDRTYWENRWRTDHDGTSMADSPANPYLETELGSLTPGTALDAGCGSGAEAIWLAGAGWKVTAVDISGAALTRASERAAEAGLGDSVHWVEADLCTWEPGMTFDLVTTHYAHPAIPQLDFYDRIADWVAPGGTLLIVGHRHGDDHGHDHRHGDDHGHDHGHDRHDHRHDHGHGDGHGRPPAEASVRAGAVAARLSPERWEIATAQEQERVLRTRDGREIALRDAIVRAVRRHAGPALDSALGRH